MPDFHSIDDVLEKVSELINLEYNINKRLSKKERFEFGDKDVCRYNQIINYLYSLPENKRRDYLSELEREANKVYEKLSRMESFGTTIYDHRYKYIFEPYLPLTSMNSEFTKRLNNTIVDLKEIYQMPKQTTQVDNGEPVLFS